MSRPLTRVYLECCEIRSLRGLAVRWGIDPNGYTRQDLIVEILKAFALSKAADPAPLEQRP